MSQHDTDASAVRYLIYARLVSQAVCDFAALGLAEIIDESDCTIATLARRSQLVPARLADLLRLLAHCGLVHVEGERVTLTGRGRYLRADQPASALPTALLVRERVGRAFDGLLTTLRTGMPVFDAVYGRSFFEEIDHDPVLRRIFDDSQARGLELELNTLLAVVSARDCGRVVDIGGGDGFLVSALLRRSPALTGVILDRAAAVDRARARFAADGLARRTEVVVGDFLAPLRLDIQADDLLIMRHICHDFGDRTCTAILARCRAAMVEGATLLVIEQAPDDESTASDDPMAAIMSLYMATVTSGRERDVDEYEKLHAAAGLTVIGVTRAGSAVVIESTAGSEVTAP